MSDHKSRNLGIAIIVTAVFLLVSLFLSLAGPWYHINGSSYLTLKNSYNLYFVHIWSEYGTGDASYVKNMDSDISKLFVSMGVLQYFGAIFFLVSFFSIIYSHREPHCTKALKITRGFSIAAFVFFLVSGLSLFLITPVYKNGTMNCFSPSPCSSFAGSYDDGVSNLAWGPSWAWGFALLNILLSLISMIFNITRSRHMLHHIPHHHSHGMEKAPILSYQPQQPVYYQPQQPVYYQPQQNH